MILCKWESYFESHHGKSPVDGIGGKIKSTIYSDVKAVQVLTGSAWSISTLSRFENCPNKILIWSVGFG